MSGVQSRGEKKLQTLKEGEGRGGRLVPCHDSAVNVKIYEPPSEELQCHIDVPYPLQRPRRHGQRRLPLPLTRNWSPDWHEEKQLPSPRTLSPGWREEKTLADSDTLPARWRDDAQPAKEDARDINLGQPTSKGVKPHSQRPAERHQKGPKGGDDEEEEESESSSENSETVLERSPMNSDEGKNKSDRRNRALSWYFDAIDHEGAWSADEDGYVHVPGGSPRGRRS